jgi:ankyrin repeat protein
VDNYGYTVLIASARAGQSEIMQYLLEEVGGDMNDVNIDGETV